MRRSATLLLRSSTVKRALRVLAGLRGHRLVLVYHRIGPPVPEGCEIVPSVPPEVFEAHLRALSEVVDLISIDQILDRSDHRSGTGPDGSRPRVAVSLDDDLPSHAEQALPILRKLGVPATFFLSGRALRGLGAYWFQHLEALLVEHGPKRAAALMGIPDCPSARVLRACERHPALRRRATELAETLPVSRVLERPDIAALASAGMTVGFHTVEHDILPDLDDAALGDALSRGREDLASASGAPVRYFAYPHGKADVRSAAEVRRAGFAAAFTGEARPIRSTDDPHRLGRWEPGAIAVDDLLVKIAVRLNRDAPPVLEEFHD